MRYISFTIKNYRGIVAPLTIALDKRVLVPIIGINECGKTTILEAILSFDYFNDKVNEGRHLKDLHNLFSFVDTEPEVSAVVRSERVGELDEVLEALQPEWSDEERAFLSGNVPNLSTDLSNLAAFDIP